MAPRHVLVVDDQQSLVHFLRCSIEERWPGCSVDVAASSRQARALLGARSYDVILTDYELRDGDGLQLATLVHEQMGGAPVVLMTASSLAPLQAGGRHQAVVAAMLHKPFDLAQLLDILEAAAINGRQDVIYA